MCTIINISRSGYLVQGWGQLSSDGFSGVMDDGCVEGVINHDHVNTFLSGFCQNRCGQQMHPPLPDGVEEKSRGVFL